MAGWTEDRTETLKRMWSEGYSGGQIADRLGLTRNAVIGKVHRLGLSGRYVPHRKAPTNVSKADRARRSDGGDRRRGNRVRRPPPGPDAARLAMINSRRKMVGGEPFGSLDEYYADQDRRTAELAALEAMPEVDVAPSNRRGIADLLDDQCRWPIGDPQRPGFHFCDHKKEVSGLPYCKLHNAKAFQPPKPKSYLPFIRPGGTANIVSDHTKALEEFELMAVRR